MELSHSVTPTLILLLFAANLLFINPSYAQEKNKISTLDSAANALPKSRKKIARPIENDFPTFKAPPKNLKKFNYFSLRLSYPITGDRFNDPFGTAFTASDRFTYRQAVKPQYKVGLELGKAYHYVDLPAAKARVGFNINFTGQMFARGENPTRDTGYNAVLNGLYIGTLGIGPQITFKPVGFVRLGLYARFGVSGIYNSYSNKQFFGPASDLDSQYAVNLQMYNFSFNKEVGIDVTIHALSVGLVWSFTKASPERGQFYQPDDKDANQFIRTYRQPDNTYGTTRTPVNPVLDYNRFSVLLGFAF